MKIFSDDPKDWIDLQNRVAYVLSQCGYIVETPRNVSTSRGTVEVDVYAQNEYMTIVCECKLWESKVPQNIIFAFRTVVADIGANKGIIVSKKGFQAGAYENVHHTNIELYSWNEFEERYMDNYLKGTIKKYLQVKSRLYRIADNKSEYLSYFDVLDKNNQRKAYRLQDKLMEAVLTLTPMCFMLQYGDTQGTGWDRAEIDNLICQVATKFDHEFLSYMDFFAYIKNEISTSIKGLEELYCTTLLETDCLQHIFD